MVRRGVRASRRRGVAALSGAPTWAQIRSMTASSGKPVVIAHRGGGGEIALNNALSAVDFAMAQGMATDPYMVMDGGDNWVSSDGILLNSHDADATTYMAPGGTVSSQTEASWAAQRLRAFPLYRGVLTDEAPPTTRAWLTKARDLGKFTVPEDKDHSTSSRNKIRDLVLELGMKDTVQVQSFQAADLGPAKAAGISVGLLQSASNNIGFPAILTAVNGGPPDLVLYDPASAPGNSDAWVQAAIDAGIDLQVGTLSRRYVLDTQKARVAAMGGHITIVPSDNPFYLTRQNTPITQDRFDTQYWEHGIISSDTSADAQIVDDAGGGRSLRFGATSASQWALMGAFADEAKGCWKTLEVDLTYQALDSTTSRWGGISWAFADDRNFHDGTDNGPGCLSVIFRQTGQIQMYNRTSSTLTTEIANTASGAVGTRSGSTLSAATTGRTVRVRIENLVDANGVFTEQARVTRLDTGQWIMSAVGAAPIRGPYMHFGKNGTGGSIVRFSNIVVTY